LLSLLVLSSCAQPKLQVRTFYTSRNDLASYVLDTPDPLKSTKGLGQTVWIRWSGRNLPNETHLDVTLRFNDLSERHEQYPLSSTCGWIMVDIPDHEYKQKGGLLSYAIKLRTKDEVLATSYHKMWTDKIEIQEL